MKRMISIAGLAVITASIISCKPKTATECDNMPSMPIKAIHENSLAYTWEQKKVHETILLWNTETMGAWEHRGSYGSLSLSDAKPYKSKNSILLESPNRGPSPRRGRNWGQAVAHYNVDNEDWTDWNRVAFWVYPDLPGHNIVKVTLAFNNGGDEKLPDLMPPNGFSMYILENQKWNKVYWEIAHLGRDKVTGLTIIYHLYGNEPGASETARFYINEGYLEKVNADHYEGWDVWPGEIAYNHAGYANGFPKAAFTSEAAGEKFYLKNQTTGETVKEGVVTARKMPTGNFRMMDFSDVNTEGKYVLEVGKLKTKPFTIGTFPDVFRSSIIKTVNHFYTQRCGYAIPGVHAACHLDALCGHEGKTLPIHGGWHDAGDLSQGVVNTAEAAYSMMMLAEKLKKTDPALYDRLMEEAEWGVSWVVRTRFDNGFRNTWASLDIYTDGIIGTNDDVNNTARKDAHANLVSSTTEAYAAKAFRDRNPLLSAHALQCAIEDYRFGLEIEPRRMNIEIIGAALNAALALFEATSDETYKKSAIEHANYLISCQQQEDLDANVRLKGFFYRNPDKDAIVHYGHRAHEQDFVVGLVKLSKLFPSEAAEWKKAVRLYADYYKEICAYSAPYYMIPAGIYDLTKTGNENEMEQIRNGVKLSERFYVKLFPVWSNFRGNSGTTLTQAKALAVVANFLQDKALLDMVYRTFDWHLGVNPFAQSLMYGEGYRFASLFSFSSGNLVGGLPVGIQTHFNHDEPYWPTETCWVTKEIWVHPSTRWLMLASDFI